MQRAFPEPDRRIAASVERGELGRLRQLYQLMTRLQQAGTREAVYQAAMESLEGGEIAFAALYAISEGRALLTGVSGVPRGHVLAPDMIAPEAPHPWPIADVVRGAVPHRMGALADVFPGVAGLPAEVLAAEVLVLPLTAAGAAARGILVLGAGRPRPGFDEFAAEIARRIAHSLLAADAIEAERERARSADMLALEVEHRRHIERQQNLLLDELNHRVKNTLATVQAIAIQTLKGADIPARDSFIARLFALSSQHDLLTLGNWEGASLEGVVRRALRPFREEGREHFTVEGPPVQLNPKRALALGMAFHELATNAARHGALSNRDGQVQVSWRVDETGKSLRLTWREQGGPPISAPGRKGFGLRLVEQGLSREISGAVALALPPEGLVCSWEMSLPSAPQQAGTVS